MDLRDTLARIGQLIDQTLAGSEPPAAPAAPEKPALSPAPAPANGGSTAAETAYVPPPSAPTVSSKGEPAALSETQQGFLAAQEAAKASVAGAHPPGTVVNFQGGHAVVLEAVTHVQDNKRTADGTSFEPSGEIVALERPRYVLGVFTHVVGPTELD